MYGQKPRIRRVGSFLWICFIPGVQGHSGFGRTPFAAYDSWHSAQALSAAAKRARESEAAHLWSYFPDGRTKFIA